MLLSGGRLGSKNPSSRRASYSETVVYFMEVCIRAACVNKKEPALPRQRSRDQPDLDALNKYIYDFRYEADPRKARGGCPMKFVDAFGYFDEERLDNFLDRGKYAQALTEINKAVELCPDSGDYIGTRGW